MRPIIAGAVAASLLLAPLAQAKPHHSPRHKSQVIVVKPGYHHQPHHNHYAYQHRELARIATFAVFSGVTYAIVDGAYYRKQGERYLYVEAPPAGSYNIIEAGDAGSGFALGQRVDRLPAGSRSVLVDGVSYHTLGETWFAPLAGGNQFVVVTSPLQ